MRLLIIHPFFPGGFSSQVEWLLQRDHDVVVIRSQPGPAFMGIKILTANYKPLSSHEDTTHPWAVRFDQGCRRAEATVAAALQLREEDWIPDLIWGHPSWGDLLMIKEVFPTSPVLFFAEYFLQPSGPERDFDSEHCVEDLTDAGLVRLARAQQLMCLEDLEMPYVSTAHAQTTFPSHYQQRIRVLHEGIPTKFFSRQPRAEALDRLRKHGCGLPEDARIVTWVSRGQELSRGFHSFIRSIPHLQKQDPELHIIAVGGDGVHYGKLAPNEEGWKAALLKEVEGEIDTQRLHWLPWSSRGVVRDVYSVSDCHLYLTAPIQLSLSPLEAMSCEAPIVTNRLPQTEEFITDGVEGLFADFFNYEEIADTCLAVAQDAAAGRAMGAAGRKKVIDTVDLATIAMPAWEKALQELLEMSAPQ